MDSLLSTDGTRVFYRTPTGLAIANGTGHGDDGRFYVDTSSFGGDCTAVLHRVTLISLARARNVLNDRVKLATIDRSLRSHGLGRCMHRE
jgi:hypothetical protein